MGLKETSPQGIDDVAFEPGIDARSTSPSSRTTDETTSVRPRKMVVLHWLTVLCVVMAAAFILTRDEVAGRQIRMWLLEGHRHFGLFVLLLFFARVVLRIRLGRLRSDDRSSKVVRIMAGLTHIALYALLLSLPLLGWALSDAQGKPVHLLGLTLPNIVGADEDLADELQAWHLDAAWALLGLVSLHIAAALWHHFVLRDGVLRTMLPRRRR
jgi:cytochrome b561